MREIVENIENIKTNIKTKPDNLYNSKLVQVNIIVQVKIQRILNKKQIIMTTL